jgi:hypothetical protein
MKSLKVKSLNVKEKALLRQLGFNPKYFLILTRALDYYEFLETQTGKILIVRR